MLVVLDNAGSADQVRPLLAGDPACAVVVTSRDAMAGLVAMDGAARLELDLLPLPEAVALLRTLIGARAAAEPAAAAELARQCCRLPLALRVAAELAASRPAVPLAGLVGELADLQTRLDLLEAGEDRRTQVRTVFSWSYRHLDTEAAGTFRLIGLHPGPELEPYAAAALTGTTVQQARQAMDELARAHLIQPTSPGRYGMHDLLRGYARELAAALDGGAEQHAALTRLFDHYLHTAAAAMDILRPAERHRRPLVPGPATPVPPLADPAAAREWLDHERAVLVAAAGHAAASGWPGHTTRLAATLDGDFEQGRFQRAADQFLQGLAVFRQTGDRAGEAHALASLGLAETLLCSYEQAARHQEEAVAIFRDIADRFGEARALGHLGWVRQLQGSYQEAAGYHQQGLALSREIADREGEAWSLARLGVVELRMSSYQRAAGYLEQSLAMFREIGHAAGEAEILGNLGEVYLGLGRCEEAAGNFERALAMSREVGIRKLETDALNGLGEVLFRTGDADAARAHHASALGLAAEAGSPQQQARAHSGLARACQAGGDPVQAHHHWREALIRYTAIGAPEAHQIRAEMAASSQ
jgi:tetratricopeptide (TPR) repeat protein